MIQEIVMRMTVLRQVTGREWFRAHNGAVTAMALSPDGDRLVTGGDDGLLKIWSTETEVELDRIDLGKQFRRHAVGESSESKRGIVSIDWSPTGRRLLVAGWNSAFVLGVVGKTILRRFVHDSIISDAKWLTSRVDNRIVTTHSDGCALTWRTAGKKLHVVPAYGLNFQKPLAGVAPANDGALLLVHGSSRIWLGDRAVGVTTAVDDGPIAEGINVVGWGLDDAAFFTGNAMGEVHVYSYSGERLQDRFPLMHRYPIRSMAKPRRCQFGATGDSVGTIAVWHEHLGHIETLTGHAGGVRCLAAPPQFDVVYSGGEDGTVRKWADLGIDQFLRKARAEINREQPVKPFHPVETGERHLDI